MMGGECPVSRMRRSESILGGSIGIAVTVDLRCHDGRLDSMNLDGTKQQR